MSLSGRPGDLYGEQFIRIRLKIEVQRTESKVVKTGIMKLKSMQLKFL